jgi:carbonic anhydrase
MSSTINNSDIINITPEKISGKCDVKCSYFFKYYNSNCNATNNGYNITLTYDKANTEPVTYNNKKYYVEQVNIYSPSVHLFNGTQSAAEIVIEHYPTLGGQPLKVAIPIIMSSESSEATNVLTQIIQTTASQAPSQGETTSVNVDNYNLERFIPKKPFYAYTETNGTEWIVYGKAQSIPLSNSTIDTLKTIITSSPDIVCPSGPLIFMNPIGPKKNIGDDIYIDCSPINASEEEIQIETSTSSSSSSGSEDFFKSDGFKMFIKIFLACIIFAVIMILMYYGFHKLANMQLPKIVK